MAGINQTQLVAILYHQLLDLLVRVSIKQEYGKRRDLFVTVLKVFSFSIQDWQRLEKENGTSLYPETGSMQMEGAQIEPLRTGSGRQLVQTGRFVA